MRRLTQLLTGLIVVCATTTLWAAEAPRAYFEDKTLGVSFDYPSDWGQVQTIDYRAGEGKSSLLQGADMDWGLGFTATSQAVRSFIRVREVATETRYRVIWYEGDADTTDLFALRESIAAHSDLAVAGYPARVTDTYFEPSASALRVTDWFAGELYFEFVEWALWGNFQNRWPSGAGPHGMKALLTANSKDQSLRDFSNGVALFFSTLKCSK